LAALKKAQNDRVNSKQKSKHCGTTPVHVNIQHLLKVSVNKTKFGLTSLIFVDLRVKISGALQFADVTTVDAYHVSDVRRVLRL